MAIRPQQDNKSEQAKTGAAVSASVPALRDNVVLNSEAIQRLEVLFRAMQLKGKGAA